MRKQDKKTDKKWNEKKILVPTVIQMEAVECGAAALAMVFAYHKKYVSLDIMREDCGVSRDGTKAVNMAKAAKKYGLNPKGFKLKSVEALKKLPLPIILFWNFNHFVVLTGIKGDKGYINDPASGPKVLNIEEVDDSFTGFAMSFETTSEFKPGGHKPSVLRPLMNRLKGSYGSLLFLVIAGLLLVIPGLLTPIFSKIFIDNILIGNKVNWLYPLCIIMGITSLAIGGLVFLQSSYLLRIHLKLGITNSAKFLHHIFRLPMRFFYQRYAGEINNRIGLNDEVAGLLSGEIATNFINIFLIIFYAVLMFQYDVLLTFISIIIVLVNLLYLRYCSAKRVIANQKVVQETGKYLGTAMGGLQIIETLKASGGESDFFSTFSGYQAKSINSNMEVGYSSIKLSFLPGFLALLNTTTILILGAYRVMDGMMTMGMLVAFQALSGRFSAPVSGLMTLGTKIQETSAQFTKLDDVLQEKRSDFFLAEDKELENDGEVKLQGYVEVKDLSFGYNKLDPPFIKNFNLKLNPGDKIALVGASGSGKSTMGKLLSGVYTPTSGEILYDGKRRVECSCKFINNSISVVDQDIFMFKGSVTENLTLWDNTISSGTVNQATRDANIHHEIAARLDGYENILTEGGRNYSGGQCQRMEIARALVKDPTILVLDEATSALDPISEKIIYDNIRKRGCTCIIVAHRLSTIRDCDEIIVMDHGEIVQRGTHNELVKIKDGPYASFIKMY